MRKLKLDPESLAVESFDTRTGTDGEGTVEGNAPTLSGACATCHLSCYLTFCPFECTGGGGTKCCTGATNCCTQFEDTCRGIC